MGQGASSDRDSGNVARRWALRAGDPERAVAGLHGNGGNNGAASGPVVEERPAEAALAFTASIVESLDDAIVGETLDGVITSWNAGAERLYGYPAREVLGRSAMGIIIQGDELPKILKLVGRGERVNHDETVGVRKDGRRVDVCVTVSPIRDGEGRIVGAAWIARDILRYVAGLAAAAAPEINNPLTAVMEQARLLADEVDATACRRIDQTLEALSRIKEIGIRMKRVTRIELT